MTRDAMALGSVVLGAVHHAVAGVCVAASVAGTSPAWPQFRGPHRDGVSAETGLLAAWPTNGPPLLWTYTNCGLGYAGVAVADGKVLTAGTFSNGTAVIALSLDGALLWSAPNGTGHWKPPSGKRDWAKAYGGVRSTPTVVAGRAVSLDVAGRLGAFDLATGRAAWSVDLRTSDWKVGGPAFTIVPLKASRVGPPLRERRSRRRPRDGGRGVEFDG